MNGVVLRTAVHGDRAYAERLREAVLRPQVEAIGPWDPAAQAARFARDWDAGGARVILHGGERVGCVATTRPDTAKAMALALFYVEPGRQGAGVGSAALRTLLDEADAAGLAVTLTTLAGSRAASLYARSGFAVTGRGRWEDRWERPPRPARHRGDGDAGSSAGSWAVPP